MGSELGLGDLDRLEQPAGLVDSLLELVARVPYQAWENVAYVAMTHTARKPGFARRVFDTVRLARWEQDNEQWHLLILEELTGKGRERQGFIEGRIKDLEGKLSALQVIDPASVDAGGRIVFGATVELEELESGARVKYQIVGDDEADIKAGLISVSSPIARALIGKSEGDVAEVAAPAGPREYEVLDVRYV